MYIYVHTHIFICHIYLFNTVYMYICVYIDRHAGIYKLQQIMSLKYFLFKIILKLQSLWQCFTSFTGI